MRNDSANALELLDAANLHCEIHYLLLSILHTNLTIHTLKTDFKKIDYSISSLEKWRQINPSLFFCLKMVEAPGI
jgi:hypothetical protein